jgi:hypothetical protein
MSWSFSHLRVWPVFHHIGDISAAVSRLSGSQVRDDGAIGHPFRIVALPQMQSFADSLLQRFAHLIFGG